MRDEGAVAVLQVAKQRRFTINPIGQRGSVGSRVLLWILFFSLAVFAGYVVVPSYVAHRMLKAEVTSEAEHAHIRSDAALTKGILEKAASWSIPVKKKDVIIRRGFDSISIDIEYFVTFTFFDSYNKTVKFRIDVIEPLKESSGILHDN